MNTKPQMSAGGQIINRMLLTGAARRSVWPVLAALFGLGMTIAVGVVWPVVIWFWIRPGNPGLAQQLLLLVVMGWAWMGVIWASFFRADRQRRTTP